MAGQTHDRKDTNVKFSMSMMLIAMLLAGACAPAAAELPAPAATGKWTSPLLKKELVTTLYAPADDAPQRGRRGRRPGIIYLKNLAAPRIGTDTDEAIISDLLKEGYLVVTVDYQKAEKTIAPYINFDLRVLRARIGADRKSKWPGLFAPKNVDGEHTYILVEGYRIKRNVLYWDEGGQKFHLDLRYPSKAKKPVPAIIQNPVENKNRAGNWVKYTFNEILVDPAMTRGYAAVLMDNPLKSYKGVDPMPEVAMKIKSAVRTTRSLAKDYPLSDKVALMGFSRGSGQAGLAGLSGGMKELEKGLHLDQSSRPDALLLHAGRMDHLFLLTDEPRVGKNYLGPFGDPKKNKKKWDEHSAITYVTKDDPPTFLSVGANDWYRVKQIARMAAAMKEAGVEYHHEISPRMGHMVTDNIGVLTKIFAFFDKHLKGIEPDPPAKKPDAAKP